MCHVTKLFESLLLSLITAHMSAHGSADPINLRNLSFKPMTSSTYYWARSSTTKRNTTDQPTVRSSSSRQPILLCTTTVFLAPLSQRAFGGKFGDLSAPLTTKFLLESSTSVSPHPPGKRSYGVYQRAVNSVLLSLIFSWLNSCLSFVPASLTTLPGPGMVAPGWEP